MQPLIWSSVALIFFASTLAAQTRTIAERLGYAPDAKLLILHADDLGTAHSVNAASFDALDKGAISSASFMIPTPWISEVAAYAKAHPDADLGIHLTLTSEWETYRWGSVASSDKVPTLLDSSGTFPNDEAIVAKKAKPAEAEREVRAQIDRARALGIHPTHADSHMRALFTTPELFAIYAKVARDHHIPFMATKEDPHGSPRAPLSGDVLVDAIMGVDPNTPPENWKQYYLDAIAGLKPGSLNVLIVHLGYDDAELRAVMVDHERYGSAWRQRDYEVVNSPEFKKALKDNNVILVKWKDLQRAAQKP